jgi:hypothetical protein
VILVVAFFAAAGLLSAALLAGRARNLGNSR